MVGGEFVDAADELVEFGELLGATVSYGLG